MAVSTFTSSFRPASTLFGADAPTDPKDRPAAQLWLNVGYLASVVLEGEDEPRFVSLPYGIPLDTSKELTPKGNPITRALMAAQNDLLSNVLAEAEALEPGQSVYIGDVDSGGLVIQIRRVNGEAVTPEGDNPFTRGTSKLFAVK